MRVIVYHNVARDGEERPLGMIDGYQPEHPVTPVAAYDVPDDTLPLDAADEAFEVFNIGDDPAYGEPDERAVAYRQRGNRSLSVGDVVGFGDAFYACGRVGWRQIERPRIDPITVYGTTAIEIS